MNKKYIKMAISTVVGALLIGGIVYTVYTLTHSQEDDGNTTSTAVMEQLVVEVDTIVYEVFHCSQNFKRISPQT